MLLSAVSVTVAIETLAINIRNNDNINYMNQKCLYIVMTLLLEHMVMIGHVSAIIIRPSTHRLSSSSQSTSISYIDFDSTSVHI